MSHSLLIPCCCLALLIGCSRSDRQEQQETSPSPQQVNTLIDDLSDRSGETAETPDGSGDSTGPRAAAPAGSRERSGAEEVAQAPDSSPLRHPLPRIAPDGLRTTLAPPQGLPARAPTASGRSADPYTTIRVFYGTNRAETGSSLPTEMYGTQRAETTFGFCEVSIPRNHQPGRLESPSIWRLEFREDPRKHVVLQRVLRRSPGQFFSALQQEVWSSMALVETPEGPALTGGEVFIFVHGYNNTFEDAARRTAQIAYDLKFAGAPVMYSWPSQARSSLEAYRTDGQMAGWSEEHLIEFVSSVARQSGARRIHLIAHSMGNRIVAGALRRLVEQCTSGRLPRFNEVILSAPDIDADYFKTAIAPRIVHSADRITIYSSSRDYALKISSFFNPLARRRLGEAGDELSVFPEYPTIDVVDATEVETDLFSLNHSYHADSPTILSDLELVLQGYTTEQRGLSAVLNRLAWQIRNVGRQFSDGRQSSLR